MAESVDALVSNTSGAIRAGSTPALGTESQVKNVSLGFFLCQFFFIRIFLDFPGLRIYIYKEVKAWRG